jgi:asparagine synthetase B (glutamine-hydrolysing)
MRGRCEVKGYVLASAVEGKRETIFQELKIRFAETVKSNQAEGLLLSGGLDSSLAAAYAKDGKAVSSTIIIYTRRW